MVSVKPGRGPSVMGGIVGCFMIGFGILWTVLAAQASGIFALFGVLWTGIAIVQTVYQFKNATSENRYSVFDITRDDEEPDPLNQHFRREKESADENSKLYCPHCGAKVQKNHRYCSQCGMELK